MIAPGRSPGPAGPSPAWKSLILSAAFGAALLPVQAQPSIRIRFADPADSSGASRIDRYLGPLFLIEIETASPDPERVDTLQAIATTDQGDHEVFKAMETDAASGIFLARAPVQGTRGYFAAYDGIIQVDGDAMDGETVNMVVTVQREDVYETDSLELGFPGVEAARRPGRSVSGRLRPGPGAWYSPDGRSLGPRERRLGRGVRFRN